MAFRFSLFALAALSCSPGELHLTTEENDSSTQEPTSDDSEPTETEQGGSSASSSTSRTDEDDWDTLSQDAPCYVNDECPTDCSPSSSDCQRCDSESDCGEPFPYCSNSMQRCVECTNSAHCLLSFGPHFSVCDRGRCVQCQHDSDCGSSELECDRGWCGSCDHDSDCDPDSRCSFGRCIPD